MKEPNKKIIKFIFLLLFFAGVILYGYADITNNVDLKYLAKFSLVPVILLSYITTSKNKNILYILALLFAFTGDLLFSVDTRTENIMAIGCFIIYNLLLTVIIFDLFGMVDLKKIIAVITITIIVICAFIYYNFNSIGADIIMIWLYFCAYSILLAFSIFYYLSFKTQASLYFLIATLLFLITNLSKTFQHFESTGNLIKVLNIISYGASYYFYCNAILKGENESENQKKLANN